MSGHHEDAAWADIVANYGDRPVLEPEDDTRQDDRPPVAPPPPRPQVSFSVQLPEEHPELADEGPQERFVPPPPPPLPRVSPDRLLAWAGVVLGPFVLLLMTLLRVHPPTILAWLLVGGFLGGFGYLVAQMPRGPRDPFDDGARL